ncbi:MAG TPA: Uma2 family endonuclease [Hyphomicrobiaceae bacterium]|nr:Uma2 family endonuclease [Hyphomicrobiaceae bacterium]
MHFEKNILQKSKSCLQKGCVRAIQAAMSTLAQRKMTVDEFLAWAEGREGRWELYNGVPYQMAPERTRHAKIKGAIYLALLRAVQEAGVPCHVLPDGVGVRISQHVMHIPDAQVYCGPELDALEVPNPAIVAEVISPSTRKFDETVKLNGYFSLPSVHHYLIVDPDGPPVVHHSRQVDGTILRSVVHDGSLTLSPPGIKLGVAELLAAA